MWATLTKFSLSLEWRKSLRTAHPQCPIHIMMPPQDSLILSGFIANGTQVRRHGPWHYGHHRQIGHCERAEGIHVPQHHRALGLMEVWEWGGVEWVLDPRSWAACWGCSVKLVTWEKPSACVCSPEGGAWADFGEEWGKECCWGGKESSGQGNQLFYWSKVL